MRARLDKSKTTTLAWATGLLLAGAIFAADPAFSASCGPDALGTSRTLVVDPTEHPRIGTMQYEETLPLRDREVVLTFDDGPLPRYSNQVLDILAAECAKATFFLVGRMAQDFPAGVRRIYNEGHTVAAHSQNHPRRFDLMPPEKAQSEIDDGIAAINAALGDPTRLAPFFRIPGLRRAASVEAYLASKGIMTWSADFPADDWRPISGAEVANLALSRLAAKGKGILLLHDIQPRTVEALPVILRELKARGYRIVHVIPADAQHPRTPTEPAQWRLHPAATATVARLRWPRPPRFVFAAEESFPVPGVTSAEQHDGELLAFPVAGARRPGTPTQLWPHPAAEDVPAITELPVPALEIFSIGDWPSGNVSRARARHAGRHPNRRANAQPVRGPMQILTIATGRSHAADLSGN